MTNNLEDKLQRIVAHMDNHESQDNTQTPQEEIQDIYVLIVREQEADQTQIVESTPVTPQKVSFLPAYAICCFYFLLILSTLVFQLFYIVTPPLPTIPILPQSQHLTPSAP